MSDDLANATSVSILDHKAARAKVKAGAPKDVHSFMLMLKRYTNLFSTLFSAQSPIYIQMHGTVKVLWEYLQVAKDNLLHEVKTSILWIILLQSRWFAEGKMMGDNACLGKFTHMVNLIKAKICAGIMMRFHQNSSFSRTRAPKVSQEEDSTEYLQLMRKLLHHPSPRSNTSTIHTARNSRSSSKQQRQQQETCLLSALATIAG